jgi:2-hydroxychromene-2-carboxylate isomerase
MVMQTFDFIYDFGSPNVYLIHKIMPQIEARTRAKAVYCPVLLGGIFKLTNNQPPMQAFGNVKNKLAYERRKMTRFIEKYDIPFQFNPHFPVMTTAIMRGAVFATGKDYESQYLDVVFDAVWKDGLKMDDPEVIGNTLEKSGLPVGEIMAGAQSQEVKDKLFALTAAAVERGAFGAPMMFVGDEPFFGKDSLPELEYTLLKGVNGKG